MAVPMLLACARSSMRTKRGRIKGTVKGAKFAQRFRAFTAKQVLLRNAQLVKTPRDSAIPDNYIYTRILRLVAQTGLRRTS